MADYSMDEIYQCDIDEYAEALGITVDDLIDMKYKEIELLQRAYDKLYERGRSDVYLMRRINGEIHSKRKKLSRLEKWRSGRISRL